MGKAVTHKVKKGETFEKIAKAYRVKDPKKLYQHSVNSKLRKMRPDPNHIQPGDIIAIPAELGNMVDLKMLKKFIGETEKQLSDRDALRKELTAAVTEMEKRLAKAKKDYNKKIKGLEVAEMMVKIGVSLGEITKQTIRVGKGLETVAKANKSHIKQIISMNETAVTPAVQYAANKVEGHSSKLVSTFGKLANGALNVTSGTFIGARLHVLQSDGFFKKVLSGKLDAAKDDLVNAYNWTFDKEVDKTLKAVKTQFNAVLVDMKKYDEADMALLKEMKAQLR